MINMTGIIYVSGQSLIMTFIYLNVLALASSYLVIKASKFTNARFRTFSIVEAKISKYNKKHEMLKQRIKEKIGLNKNRSAKKINKKLTKKITKMKKFFNSRIIRYAINKKKIEMIYDYKNGLSYNSTGGGKDNYKHFLKAIKSAKTYNKIRFKNKVNQTRKDKLFSAASNLNHAINARNKKTKEKSVKKDKAPKTKVKSATSKRQKTKKTVNKRENKTNTVSNNEKINTKKTSTAKTKKASGTVKKVEPKKDNAQKTNTKATTSQKQENKTKVSSNDEKVTNIIDMGFKEKQIDKATGNKGDELKKHVYGGKKYNKEPENQEPPIS